MPMEIMYEALLKASMLEEEQKKKEEKKTLQRMIQELELMLKEQKEYSTTLREEDHQQTPRQGQVSETNDV